MKKLINFILSLLLLSSVANAQGFDMLTDDNSELLSPEVNPQSKKIDIKTPVAESGAFESKDPLINQLGSMLPELADSLGRLENRITTLAVSSITFSPGLGSEFQKVAIAKIYGQILASNPKVKMIKCEECNMLRSEIKYGILTISRGISDEESRRAMARKLQVQGFMEVYIQEKDRQLSLIVNVYDAQEGRVILSDVITGQPKPETLYYNVYIGQLFLPVTYADGGGETQTAVTVGIEHAKRFAENWYYGINLLYYQDNNSKLEKSEKFKPGFMLDGSAFWELSSSEDGNRSIQLAAGFGQFISNQFNYSPYLKVGGKMVVGRSLTFNLYYLTFKKTNLESPDDDGDATYLNGNGYYLGVGYQF